MKTSDYFYDLPKELIAQTPLERRDSSRLFVLGRENGAIEHRHFYDILDYLHEGDCLIMNDSRVLPARIYGVKKGTGARVEFLLLTQHRQKVWVSAGSSSGTIHSFQPMTEPSSFCTLPPAIISA